MRVPTGAMASKVRAPASAMITVLDGMFCAPIAPRTICSTVEIFTNAVNVMNANGKSAANAKITTKLMGRMNASSSAGACAGAASATPGSSSVAIATPSPKLRLRLLAERTTQHLPKRTTIALCPAQIERAVAQFSELRNAGLTRSDDVDHRADAHQIHSSPRV